MKGGKEKAERGMNKKEETLLDFNCNHMRETKDLNAYFT